MRCQPVSAPGANRYSVTRTCGSSMRTKASTCCLGHIAHSVRIGGPASFWGALPRFHLPCTIISNLTTSRPFAQGWRSIYRTRPSADSMQFAGYRVAQFVGPALVGRYFPAFCAVHTSCHDRLFACSGQLELEFTGRPKHRIAVFLSPFELCRD